MDFDAYSLDDSIFDEVFHPDGLPREQCSQLYQALRELSVEEITTIPGACYALILERRHHIHRLRR